MLNADVLGTTLTAAELVTTSFDILALLGVIGCQLLGKGKMSMRRLLIAAFIIIIMTLFL